MAKIYPRCYGSECHHFTQDHNFYVVRCKDIVNQCLGKTAIVDEFLGVFSFTKEAVKARAFRKRPSIGKSGGVFFAYYNKLRITPSRSSTILLVIEGAALYHNYRMYISKNKVKDV